MKLWRKPLDRDRLSAPRGAVHIQTVWCKGCRYCVVFCPTQVLELSTDFNAKGYHYPIIANADACVDCRLCERLCPEYSIVVTSNSRHGEVHAAHQAVHPKESKPAAKPQASAEQAQPQARAQA